MLLASFRLNFFLKDSRFEVQSPWVSVLRRVNESVGTRFRPQPDSSAEFHKVNRPL